MNHHPSCKDSDIDLMRVCSQCGDKEHAVEIDELLEQASIVSTWTRVDGKPMITDEGLVYHLKMLGVALAKYNEKMKL